MIRAYSRAERKNQIILTLAIRAEHGGKPQATMYQIAKSLDMRPSTHLQKILMEMLTEHLLTVETAPHRPNKDKRLWKLPNGQYQLPLAVVREIPITQNGKSKGVMSL